MQGNRYIAGIINMQMCDSHGGVILAYALQNVVNKFGYDAQIIDYIHGGRLPEKNIAKKIIRKIKYIMLKQMRLSLYGKKIAGKSLKGEFNIQHKRFVDFRQQYLSRTDAISNPQDNTFLVYDALIVGSDVVWKPEVTVSKDKQVYYLRIGREDAIRIAYAASIGTDDQNVLAACEKSYEGAFDSLDYISIREQSMIDFVKKFTEKKVISVIDPVFLLEKEEYIKIERKNDIPKDYVYVYIIADNKKAIVEANKIAKKLNAVILLDLSAGFSNEKVIDVPVVSGVSAGPLEFLYNVRHAKYVITDSFHATAFSLIYNRPFWVFDRGNISVRMRDLLNRFGLSERRYTGDFTENEICWDKVNRQIQEEKENGLRYLREALFHADK